MVAAHIGAPDDPVDDRCSFSRQMATDEYPLGRIVAVSCICHHGARLDDAPLVECCRR